MTSKNQILPEDARLRVAFSMQRGRHYTENDLSNATGINPEQVCKALRILHRKGFIEKEKLEGCTSYTMSKSKAAP